ncbi:protein tipE [Anabrus simplex]|uniref:protein tipE n=1 Tax=Anabrus simplex TaxID=316456 RepID=UPI0035A3B41B
MRSSSSELLLDQQQELRKRKLLELAQPKKTKPPKRTCREKIWFYTTSFLAMTAVAGGSALLFLVPLYVDPAISTLAADFVPVPVKCVTTRREDLSGIFNCSWSSCREGCTSDMYACLHVFVSYTTTPYNTSNDEEDVNSDKTDEAVLLDNIKGCGYPPEVDCDNFTKEYSEPGSAYPCYYSRENRSVVLTHYDRDRHVTVILHYFAVPFVVTLASSVVLCVMYCDCRCSSGRDRRRRQCRRSAVEDARYYYKVIAHFGEYYLCSLLLLFVYKGFVVLLGLQLKCMGTRNTVKEIVLANSTENRVQAWFYL